MPDSIKNEPVLVVDFIGGAVGHRRRFGGGRRQALPRAMGLKPGVNPVVIDATAGLGRDAFLLASLGCRVTMIERSSFIHGLLADGMARALDAGGEMAEIMGRMQLVHGDAIAILSGDTSCLAQPLNFDAILIDPMHPVREKSALVKAEMRLIRDKVGADDDKALLIAAALNLTSERVLSDRTPATMRRVVVKWPTKAALPSGIRPASHQIIGKTTRYDVFMQAMA